MNIAYKFLAEMQVLVHGEQVQKLFHPIFGM